MWWVLLTSSMFAIALYGKTRTNTANGLEISLFERQHKWELRIMFEHEGDVGRIACHHHPMARKSLAIASKRVTALLHNLSRD
jgi:hypothetical protein